MKIKLTTEALARRTAHRPWTTIGVWLGVTLFIIPVYQHNSYFK